MSLFASVMVEAARERLLAIAQRQALLSMEQADLRAEETVLRRRLRKHCMEQSAAAASMQPAVVKMEKNGCAASEQVQEADGGGAPGQVEEEVRALGDTKQDAGSASEQVAGAGRVVEEEKDGGRASGHVEGAEAAVVAREAEATGAAAVKAGGRGERKRGEAYCPGCRYAGTKSSGAHLWVPPCLRSDPQRAAKRAKVQAKVAERAVVRKS